MNSEQKKQIWIAGPNFRMNAHMGFICSDWAPTTLFICLCYNMLLSLPSSCMVVEFDNQYEFTAVATLFFSFLQNEFSVFHFFFVWVFSFCNQIDKYSRVCAWAFQERADPAEKKLCDAIHHTCCIHAIVCYAGGKWLHVLLLVYPSFTNRTK